MVAKKNTDKKFKILIFVSGFLVLIFAILTAVLFNNLNKQNQKIDSLETVINQQKDEIFALNVDQEQFKELKNKTEKIDSDIQYIRDNSLNAKDKIDLLNKINSIEKFNKIYSGYNFLRANKLILLKMKINTGLPFEKEFDLYYEFAKKDVAMKAFINAIKDYKNIGIKNDIQIVKDFNALREEAVYSEKYKIENSGSFLQNLINKISSVIKITKEKKDNSDSVENILFTIEGHLDKLNYEDAIKSMDFLKERYPDAFNKLQEVYKNIVIKQKVEMEFLKTVSVENKNII